MKMATEKQVSDYKYCCDVKKNRINANNVYIHKVYDVASTTCRKSCIRTRALIALKKIKGSYNYKNKKLYSKRRNF